MATSFNLQEYILFRTEIKRELTNGEVDTNFQMVSNPWVTTRIYEIGNIVYHPVIVDDPATTGEDQVLAWWRSNIRTTQGVFDTSQWDMIGGIGSGNINIQGANSFGKIKVNSTTAPGPLQTGNDAVVSSTNPNDTFNFIAGAGMQLQYNVANKVIKLVNTLAVAPGEINIGKNIGLGATHQDIYSGKVGVDLEFYGLDASNTGGAALTVVAPGVQNNVVYNFNEGFVDLTNLNSGSPTINMLSNVSSAIGNVGDILQLSATNVWSPVDPSFIGATNIYGADGTILIPTRVVTLNGTAGNLQFNRGATPGTGIDFSNTAASHQIGLRDNVANGAAAMQYSLASVAKATAGVYGIDDSFGITMTAALAGVSVDALSISSNSELFIPQIATDTVTAASVSFRIPFVNEGTVVTGNTALDKGKFESTNNYRLSSYTDQGGSTDMAGVRQIGDYSFKGVSRINTSQVTSFEFINEHDFAGNVSLTNGYGMTMSYLTPSNKEADTIIQHMNETSKRFTGYNFAAVNSTMPVGTEVKQYLGSNITLDDMAASTTPDINVGSIINFSDTTGGAGVQPQRVGLYSNVVSSYTGAGSQDGAQSITQLIADSGTWAGYFVGCVNIDQGGLVLPSTATQPVCNHVSGSSIEDRTLWINSANGHLYRGSVDVEGAGGSSTLAGLTDVGPFPSPIPDDSLLVYNSSSSKWEAATLAAYNLNAIALTNGDVSIQLSDGVASSDVDLLAGTNVTFSVNETTDEITINASGGGAQGAQGFQGATGAQGDQGLSPGILYVSTTVTTTPGNGLFYYDDSTDTFYINKTDGYGVDQSIWIDSWDDSGDNITGFGYLTFGTALNDKWRAGFVTSISLTGNVYTVVITETSTRGVVSATVGFYSHFAAYGSNGAQGNQGFQGAVGTGAQGNQGFQGTAGAQGNQGNTGGAQGSQGFQGTAGAQGPGGAQGNQGNTGGAQGAQGNQGFQGPQPIATLTADTLTTVDISNVMGNYCNMAAPNTNVTYTFTNTGSTLGGFGRVLFNTTSQPAVTGAFLIKGDSWIASTNMYMTIQFNGNRTEYWLEQITP